jgi:glycosyltransferase involved in cell wall biosynthesis
MKASFIAWINYQRRSDLLAQYLGAKMHFIYNKPSNKLIQTPIRYIVQAIQTWRILRYECPDIIFVQNPPIFCVLIASIYARCYGAHYIIDSHTGAFLSSKWRWSVGLHRLLSKSASLTLVHNKSQEKIVKEWECRYLVLRDPLGCYPDTERFLFSGQFNVVVVSSFAQNEPNNIIFESATKLPSVTFYVTGNYKRADPTLLKIKPDNLLLTGYIPYQQYMSLLQSADVVINLVLNGDTLLSGAYEAISLGTPMILSDWPILKDAFPLGAVYVPNTAEGLCKGVNLARQKQQMLRQEILVLRDQLQSEWERKFAELQQLIQQ